MEVQLAANTVTKVEMEEYFSKLLESRLQQAMEEFVERNELKLKELSLIERVVRVEEELKYLREMSEVKFEAMEKRFEALQREMIARFEAVDKRFEALQREMIARFEAVDKRFEAVDKRFETVDKRFESLQREMNARFEAMDKRFSVIQWMIGILVGIPALVITLKELVSILK
jgi:flagellar capping protein FliD